MTEDQLRALRNEIGDMEPPEDWQLEEAYDRLGSVDAVALEVLRKRLREFEADPAKMSLDGIYTHDSTENIKSLSAAVAALEARLALDPPGPAVLEEAYGIGSGRLVRKGGSWGRMPARRRGR